MNDLLIDEGYNATDPEIIERLVYIQVEQHIRGFDVPPQRSQESHCKPTYDRPKLRYCEIEQGRLLLRTVSSVFTSLQSNPNGDACRCVEVL